MTARWTRIALAAALLAGTAIAIRDVAPVSAQPAMAVGQPLPDDKLEARTVMVRVIAGNRDKPVTGVDVTLAIIPPDGSATIERVARTDAEGRAAFVDLPSGAVVTAKVTGPGGDQTSTGFPVPVSGGTRVLLSTVPMAGAAPATGGSPAGPAGAGGPMAGGPMAGGQPQPRMMSGRPRPQAGDPGDTLTVRLTYDDMVDPRPPQDQPVVLVAYRYDQTVTATIVKSDPAGRAVFAGLDRTGATSYFAMTTLERGTVHDRVTSGPIQMVADDGLRLMLSGEKRDGGKPAADDLSTLSPQPPEPVAPGVIEVVIAGVPEDGAAVELVDAVTGKVLATDKAGPPMAAAGSTEATWKPPIIEPSIAAGSIEFTVTLDGQPAPPLTIEVRRRTPVISTTPTGPTGPAPAGRRLPPPVDAPPVVPPPPLTATTDAQGKATITGLRPGEEVDVVIVTPAGPSKPSVVRVADTAGVRVSADVLWKERGQASARLTGAVAGADRAYFVRTTMHGQLNLSAPFQVTPERGAQVSVVAMPRVMLNFSLTSWVDDQFLAVSGQFTVSNSSWAPYLATKNGRPTELVVPLPSAATGLQVRDDFASLVGTDPSRGLLLRRPLPPGGLEFSAGFSMKIQDGEVVWDMPLPLGSFESGLEVLRSTTATRIVVPKGTKASVEEASDRRGKFWVMSPITILPPQRMVFTIAGLPQPPGWNHWAKVVVGILALIALIGGLALALHRGAATAARDATRARYDRLLDDLARLEAEGTDPDRRAAMRAELEALRERLDHDEASPGVGA